MISKTYDPKAVEKKWYQSWEEHGYFHANADTERDAYTIVIPPPNVTGSLHIGHALNSTLQDVIIRWRRMQGYETLWLPGLDHAGIATQNQVERMLAKEKLTRYDLGREEFSRRVWEWADGYGNTIVEQLKRLGCSCDWQRKRFTLDQGLSAAVREAFCRYYEKGLIYRGNYMVNWCPRCKTALSELEVRYRERTGELYYIKYPLRDSTDYVTVATTRPETMLGDTAVAVNPKDKRYSHLRGKLAILPLVKREIPIIEDKAVDPSFGTGAVKITPSHDPNDFEIGRKRKLAFVEIMDEDAKISDEAPQRYRGLSREDARKRILDDLKRENLLERVEPHSHSVGTCARCDTIVEPRISEQWFVKTKPLAEPAIKAVEDGTVKFIPERWAKVYLDWMYNIRDWCISRQLWWGHRIPVWYCDACGEIIVSREDPQACGKCHSSEIRQDEDVLDTWFSSALWPFSTLGWPEDSSDMKKFYPTDLLVTDLDIINLWVARMIMSGFAFTSRPPFPYVYIHSTVLNEKGERMSRSRGTGIDPIASTEKYGTDGVRFTLAYLESQVQSFRFWESRFEMGRNFANKVWNAARLLLPSLKEFRTDSDQPDSLELADRWMLSRYNHVVHDLTDHLEALNFSRAAQTVYWFFWHEFCDWWLELAKSRLSERDTAATWVGWTVLEGSLRMLHPFMPFVTEELWHLIPHEGSSIMKARWPQPNPSLYHERAEEEMGKITELITAVRTLRGEFAVPEAKKARAIVKTQNEELKILFESHVHYIIPLAKLESIHVGPDLTKPKHSATSVTREAEIYVPLKALIDLDVERKRIDKELEVLKTELQKVQRKLGNQDFLTKAPQDVVARSREKKEEFEEKLSRLTKNLTMLED
ncbi:valyl-tRNA synthetase [candidate division TA06 bacterium DG_26]|uniref:Valine--tRNA ligase n=1 Tax=candidate division TA06 bacterium DG_26 TaxID=1703771 RepID=A0A0S7WM60_UNCT6|nr:MAG: valyl-tRNA synthetase [candidate division TA06 bacterium DG_26]